MSHTPQEVFLRWRLAPDEDPDRLRARLGEAADELLGAWHRSPDGRWIDVNLYWEHRRHSPLVGAEDALFHGSPGVEAIWIRVRCGFSRGGLGDDDEDVDGIGQVDAECDRLAPEWWRPCRYGFDEIVVTGAAVAVPGFVADGDVQRWRGAGSYLARACSAYLNKTYEIPDGAPIARPEPIDVLTLVRPGGFARVEWRWAGRVVHAATPRPGGVVHHAAGDGWDNCVDDVYLERAGDPARRRPAHVYESDRRSVADFDQELDVEDDDLD